MSYKRYFVSLQVKLRKMHEFSHKNSFYKTFDTFVVLSCGLCDYKADNLNTLKIDHATCEIYECDNCYFRVTTLSEIKKHLEKKHKDEDDVKVIHGKINRKDEDEVYEVEYMQCEL